MSATMLHGDWRVVPPSAVPLTAGRGPGQLEAKVEHPYRRSVQNGDSVEAPHSAQKVEGSCLETTARALEAAGTRSHCSVQVPSVPHGFWTSLGSILGPQILLKSRPQGAPEALPDGYYSEMEKN